MDRFGCRQTHDEPAAPTTIARRPASLPACGIGQALARWLYLTALLSFGLGSADVAAAITSVTVTAPAANTTIITGKPRNLVASTVVTGATVSSVQFYNGASLLGAGTASGSTYTLAWTPATAGAASITARATDSTGATKTSAAVPLTVVAPIVPTVSVTAPAANASVYQNAALSLSASAAAKTPTATLASVQFYNGTTLLGTGTLSGTSYNLSWTPTTPGAYSLTAKATDSFGTVATSAAVPVTVLPLPTVSTTAPAANTTIITGKARSLTATATTTAAGKTIASVQFYNGATLLGAGTASGSSYTLAWTPSAAGTASITAKATDSGGGAKTSAAVPLTVVAPIAPTVSVTAPAANASVYQNAALSLSASAAAKTPTATLASVQFYNGTTLLGTGTLSGTSYNLSWTPTTPAAYSITAKATDSFGTVATSTAVPLTVKANLTTPVISAPANNASIYLAAPITLKATASVGIAGTLSSVQFYNGTTLLGAGTLTGTTYNRSWTPAATGTYSVTARATDSFGHTATSAATAITIKAAPEIYYIYADHIDTPRVITRASDNQRVWRWDQAEPFGIGQPDQNPSALGSFVYNLRFPGQYYDSETGLYHNGFRDYDPVIGRYIESDPIGLRGGINTYAYVGNNPISYLDPNGTNALAGAEVGGEVGGAIGGPVGAAIGIVVGGLGGATLMDTLLDKADKARERKEYSRICKTPIQPTGDKCLDAKANLSRLEQCLKLREDFGRKWYNDADPGHEQANEEVRRAIDNLKDWINKNCKDKCNQ